jgi:tRNA(Ile)-lysidine synthase
MLQPFQAYIQKWCKTTDKILLAVSGGLDSMVMLHLFSQLKQSFGVAHCNFQLRGAESERDEAFVKTMCGKLNIPFHSKRFETNNYAIEKGLSIQMAARELRYEWFEELRQAEDFEYVATAHHLNDSIETILLNLTKGAGLEGLMGIRAQNKKVIRPMLFATREEIEKYAAENGIAWREDQSNASDDYQRNFIRHQIVPRLKELNQSLEKTMMESITKMQGAANLINATVAEWKKKFVRHEGDRLLLDKKGISEASDSTIMLWEVLKPFGFNYGQCESIVNVLEGQSGKRFSSKTHELVIDRLEVIVSEQSVVMGEVLIERGESFIPLGKWQLKIESKKKTELVADRSIALLDEAKLAYPLVWRKWRAGDSFQPLGMKGKKKVSDFLIDEKVSVIDKESVTVLESAGEIVWVVGMRVDERVKVREGTERVVQVIVQAHR